jgi:hypothetical protein
MNRLIDSYLDHLDSYGEVWAGAGAGLSISFSQVSVAQTNCFLESMDKENNGSDDSS